METTCNQCKSRFRITEKQLRQAYGKVCCGECGCVFNALNGLKNYDGALPPGYLERIEHEDDDLLDATVPIDDLDVAAAKPENRALSLHEAMYGSERRSFFSLGPLAWFIGILLLCAAAVAQAIYYQRYQLVKDPRYQQQVVNLCRVLPCNESEFSSPEQFRLLERNVFTHPIESGALMITGSFVNEAPFAQRLPRLLISLFDVQGKLIANRIFGPAEYLTENRNRGVVQQGLPVQFRLEIVDPGTNALTYEFEFL